MKHSNLVPNRNKRKVTKYLVGDRLSGLRGILPRQLDRPGMLFCGDCSTPDYGAQYWLYCVLSKCSVLDLRIISVKHRTSRPELFPYKNRHNTVRYLVTWYILNPWRLTLFGVLFSECRATPSEVWGSDNCVLSLIQTAGHHSSSVECRMAPQS